MASNIDIVVQRLGSAGTDIKQRVESAGTLRDSLDHYTTGVIYPAFLKKLVPIFVNILKGPPVFISSSGEQKLRNTILEIVHRLPSTPAEPLEPFAVELVDLLMKLIRIENEDNAILCVKTIMDIMRHQTKVMQDKVQPFISLIREMFDGMEAAVRDQLDSPVAANTAPGVPSTPNGAQTFVSLRPVSPVAYVNDIGADPQQQTKPLLKGMQSFKVLAECPIIVVSIFQVYRATVPPNVKLFVPLIKSTLLLQAKPQKQAHAEAASRGTIFTGVSLNIRNRAAFGEFITAQVKTMSFLAYLLRIYAGQLQDFLPSLPGIVVRLLQDIPREKSGARKELLVAIRHIINFNFRKIFLKNISGLLDERTLIGEGLTVHETMRPLAYSMLADLIHHVRESLEPEQIRKTVIVYTKNLQDSFPGTSFQTMSAKLLLNMADCIAKMPNKADVRHYLMMILTAIGDKFAAMNRQYDNAVKLSKHYAQYSVLDSSADNCLADKDTTPDWDEIDIFTAMPIKTTNARDRAADPVADNKFLFRNLMSGLKNIFYQLKVCNNSPVVDEATCPPHWRDVYYGFSAEEVQVIVKLFREGAYVFRYYEIEKPSSENMYASTVEFLANHYMVSSSKEEKDLLETFATVFHCIDPATFHEVFHEEIPHLYEMIFHHTALLHIPQFFLASEATSPSFAGMLLRFLMDRIDQVGTADVKKSSILLRLFKLSFMAVTLFSNQNEAVLLPHVLDIVTKSIELSTTAEEPMNYFLLLRSLFRSIGGGKFEHLYKQILPLLEMLLEVLNNLLLAARKPADRDLYVELCLTVPARLSNLLPHLSYLMRPLVVALRAGSELVGQGLRTLELCVDNLTADYLDPIMAPVIDELMTALFDHLRPSPYSHFHAHTTMRILGKLGGRNRKFMNGAPLLNFQQYADDTISYDLRLIGSRKDRAMPAEVGVDMAIGKLMEVPNPNRPVAKKSDPYYKKQAFKLIKAQLKLCLGSDHLPDDFPRLVRLQAQDLIDGKSDADFSSLTLSDKARSVAKKEEQVILLKKLIKACIFTTSLSDLREEATAIVKDICRHFTLLEVGRTLADNKIQHQAFDVKYGEGPLVLDNRVLADAMVDALSSDNPVVRDGGEMVLQEVYNNAAIILGSHGQAHCLSFFGHLAEILCHSCHEEEWFTKSGGSFGIDLLLTKYDLGDKFIAQRQHKFVSALLYVIKDMPRDLPAKTRIKARATLEILLRRLSPNIPKTELQFQPPTENNPRPPLTMSMHFVGLFVKELPHANKHVRLAAHAALKIISETTGIEIHKLIAPHKDLMLNDRIYSKPLRALPFATQIGYIDAVTYCMALKHDLVSFKNGGDLERLLTEALHLAEADDGVLAGKPAEYRTHESIIELRVSCIKVLKTAMQFDEFAKGPDQKTRAKVIACFFKCLYSESSPTVEAANSALQNVLTLNPKLPKDILQNGLRPVLANLQDPRRLSIHGLEGLARLLQLLTTYFKVEIGSRLLDHIKVIADASVLQKVSYSMIEQDQSIKIIAAVFHIFHLLPPAAEHFKGRLIDTCLELEEKLRRTRHSPFRAPLLKYLNRFPKEVWRLLLGKVEDQKYGRFLAQVLEAPESGPMREEAVNNVESLIKSCGDMGSSNKEGRYATVINAINIMHAVNKFPGTGNWMKKKDNITWFKLVGKNLEIHLRSENLPPNLRLAAEQAGDQLMEIMTKYLELHPKDLDALFALVDSITHEEMKPSQIFVSYIYKNIICNASVDYWKLIILRCLDVYAGKSASHKTKAFLLHNLVNPIIAMDAMRLSKESAPIRSSRLVDKSILEPIQTRIWKVSLGDAIEELTQPNIDFTRMEVLQLTAMLVKYYAPIVQDFRKDIIKFGWTYIRLEDVINKHAAYVVIGYFIAHYETPLKIVTQTYFSLLKTNQNEGRALVMQALELIAPVLPARCNTPIGDRNPVWASGARRILSEDSQNVQQMTAIFHFLVKHPDLFYESRDKFAAHIINNLRKIAVMPTASNESKKLVLLLMSLIWKWEQKRVEGIDAEVPRPLSESPNLKKRRLEALSDNQVSSPAQSGEKSEYQIPISIRQKMIKYLVEFIAGKYERYPLSSAKVRESTPTLTVPVPASTSTKMVKKAMTLLHNFLLPQYWGDVQLDLFENVTGVILKGPRAAAALASEQSDKEKPDEKYKFITNMINTLQVVRIIVNMRSDDWILKYMPELQAILDKSLHSENPELQECLHGSDLKVDDGRVMKSLVTRILDAVPDDVPMEDADAEGETEASTSEFVTFLCNIGTETLSSGNLVSGINILWSLAQRMPSELDIYIGAVQKVLSTKLAKDHVAYCNAQPQQIGMLPARAAEITPNTILDKDEFETQTLLIRKAIDIIAMRMDNLADNRRPFLSVLATLVEKSISVPLCLRILDLVEHWVFKAEGSWPTMKEKTAVLHKMLTFESRLDPTLLHRYLELVIRIYEDPKVTRTELTVRMEHAFLIGTRAQDVEMRNRFMSIFDKSQSKTASARFSYVLTSQNWDTLADTYWLAQASQLLLGAVEMNNSIQYNQEDFKVTSASVIFGTYAKDAREPTAMEDDKFETLMADHRRFISDLGDVKVRDIIEPLTQLQHTDQNLAHDIWCAIFPIFFAAMPKDEREDLTGGMAALLTKDYHSRQIDKRPNIIQSLLIGAARCRNPYLKIPPHIAKTAAMTYDAWYTVAVQLEEIVIDPSQRSLDTPLVRESSQDALVELYATLKEEDLYFGTWRRRCSYYETNAALSYEQNGMWDKAQSLYEAAQIKARMGQIPFSQCEYLAWEDHWVECAQKLQQWEVLGDFARHENYQDLILECAYKQLDYWTDQNNRDNLDGVIKGLMDAPTPRRTFFQAFMSLLRLYNNAESQIEFSKVCDESIQLSIKKWHQLPKRVTAAHIPILQNFQQLVELHDASVIISSLHNTNAINLDVKSGELKLLLSTWRDRLPNVWDDINAWQDLVTWRQHIFGLINSTYLQLLSAQSANANGASYAYRGYHETAWIVNRFAHVARKHNLNEVCINQLSRIYTLPNIEIQEAFLKLREQAKCHYQNPPELTQGLEVINNTNLGYFVATQKAEFYTLKGMFLDKLGSREAANEAFGTALFFEIKLPKAWAEWGYYNDRLFKKDPKDYQLAKNALSSYLEAAGTYKNGKSRKLLTRILWLLSLDDASGSLSGQYDDYKGETPVWYWITFIPQLLTGLGHKEAPKAFGILSKIARSYPQALYFQLRTTREDMIGIRKTQEQKNERERRMKALQAAQKAQTAQDQGEKKEGEGSTQSDGVNIIGEDGEKPATVNGANGDANVKSEAGSTGASSGAQGPPNGSQHEQAAAITRPPWEYAEELLLAVKTSFPLLALSMETMVDQIQKYFKCPPDEDAYRLIVALLNDALAYVSRMPHSYAQDVKLPSATETNITRFAETILPAHIRKSFEADFVVKKPTMHEYIHKLRRWRDKFEEKLDRRPMRMSLENYGYHLSEFRFLKFDEVEVPGQYLQHKDKNQDFVRIDRFLPNVDQVRAIGVCHRRLKIRGHDGSVHPFAIQHPAARHCRREERILQLFRHFNVTLRKRKESRRRNLQFHLPLMIPLAPHIRMVQDDATYISLQAVFEDHCRRNGSSKDEPTLFFLEKLRALTDNKQNIQNKNEQILNARLEILHTIMQTCVPHTLALDYFKSIYPCYDDFFLFRRHFSYQFAALTFMTYILHMHNRHPSKISISRATGAVWGSELMSCMAAGKPVFHNPEQVPFRLTPNLQTLMGPIGLEGIFSCALMVIARCLTDGDGGGGKGEELEPQLALWVRDEMIFWYTSSHRNGSLDETTLRESVEVNSGLVVKRALSFARTPVENSAGGSMPIITAGGGRAVPANQTVIDFIAKATNPVNLATMDALWMAYL